MLPQRLDDLHTRVTEPDSPLVHAWGTPAVVLTCGVSRPAAYHPSSASLIEINGVSWFPQVGQDEVTWTTRRAGVYASLVAPRSYKAQANYLVDLAPAVSRALPAK